MSSAPDRDGDARWPPAEQLAAMLDAIERSQAFRGSARHRRFLRHLVERCVAGEASTLKESVLAVEVFGRQADRFDPRSDTIVRVEARRLRRRLADFRQGEGRTEPWQVVLPVGSYVPQFERTPPPPAPQVSRRARDLCERGEHFLRQPLAEPVLRQAIERFEAARALSPGLTEAEVGLGRAWLNLATGWYEPPAEAASRAAQALDRALAQAPRQPVAMALRAAIHSQFDRSWPQARRMFEAAVRAAPQTAFVHSAFGAHLVMNGRFDEAERELQLARRLDPQYLNTRMHLVNLRIARERWRDAQAELDALADLAPGSIAVLGLRGAIALYGGQPADAVRWYRQAADALPSVVGCRVALAGALAATGQPAAVAEADGLIEAIDHHTGLQQLSPYLLAIWARWRGRPDDAFAQLEQALQRRDPQAIQIPDEPAFRALHADARFAPLARRARRP